MCAYILGIILKNSAETIVEMLKGVLSYKHCFVGYQILSYFPEDMDLLPMVRTNMANFGIPEKKEADESATLKICGNHRIDSWDGKSPVFVVQSRWVECILDMISGEPAKDPGENIIAELPLSKGAALKNAFEYIRRDFDTEQKHLWQIAGYLEAAGEKKRALEYYKQMCESHDPIEKYLGSIRSLELLPCPSMEYIECLNRFAEANPDLPETSVYLSRYLQSYPALPRVRVQSSVEDGSWNRFNRFGILNRGEHYTSTKEEMKSILAVKNDETTVHNSLTIVEPGTFVALESIQSKIVSPITLHINVQHMADRSVFEPYFNILFGEEELPESATLQFNGYEKIVVGYSTLFRLCNDLARRATMDYYVQNIGQIDRILDPVDRALLWFDIEPSEESVRRYLDYQRQNAKRAVYIGVGEANIGPSEYLNRTLEGNQFILIGGASAGIQRNVAGLLPRLGVSDASGVVVWKHVRDPSLMETNEHFVNFIHPSEIYFTEKNRAHVINLRERKDRWEQVQKDLGDCLALERFEAVRRSPGWIGCFLSHQAIIREAKRRGDNTVLIVEDDCYLDDPATFQREWAHIKHWLDTNLDKWDIFLGGCGCVREEDVQHVFSDNVSGVKFVQLSRSTSTHFIYWNRSLFDRILSYTPTPENYMPIDVYSWHVLGARILTIVPFLAKQRESYSDIEDRVVEYEGIYNASTLSIQKRMEEVAQTPIFFWSALDQRTGLR